MGWTIVFGSPRIAPPPRSVGEASVINRIASVTEAVSIKGEVEQGF
jgi:hypothetical protein